MLEPEIIFTSGSLTTNAVAGTTNTGTAIAAPGAGLRIRLYYAKMVVQAGSPAGRVEFRARKSGGGSFPFWLACASAGNNGDWWSAFPNGVHIGSANQSLDYIDSASVASMTYRYAIGYTIERV